MGFWSSVGGFFKKAGDWLFDFFQDLFSSDEFKKFTKLFYQKTLSLVLEVASKPGMNGPAKRDYVINGLNKYAQENALVLIPSFCNLLIELIVNNCKLQGKIQ